MVLRYNYYLNSKFHGSLLLYLKFFTDNPKTSSQNEFDEKYGSKQPLESGPHRFRRNLRRAFLSSCSSKEACVNSIFSFLPILSWLPNYDWRNDFLSDIVGGVTSGIMNIPQGISYSLLAGVAPVYGIYASCFPAFFYMLFGTSKHTSLGMSSKTFQ